MNGTIDSSVECSIYDCAWIVPHPDAVERVSSRLPRVPAGLHPAEIRVCSVWCGGFAATPHRTYFFCAGRRPAQAPTYRQCIAWRKRGAGGSLRGRFLDRWCSNAIRRDRLLPVRADVFRISADAQKHVPTETPKTHVLRKEAQGRLPTRRSTSLRKTLKPYPCEEPEVG